MAEIHIDVGIAALERGFITHEAFMKAVAALATSNGQSVHELWVGQGHMTAAQLETVLVSLGKSSETRVVATGTITTPEHRKTISPGELSTNVGKKPGRSRIPTGQATAPTAASIVNEPPPPDPSMLDPGTDRLSGSIQELLASRY